MRKGKGRISRSTIGRLPLYLRCLAQLSSQKVWVVSSEELGRLAGTNAAQVRKDLSYLGEFGTRGVGYDVGKLTSHLSKTLGLNRKRYTVVVGVGNLGSALLKYKGFRKKGFEIVAAFDKEPGKIGKRVGGVAISDINQIEQALKGKRVDVGVITTPASVAQAVADQLVAAKVPAILNFAPVSINVPKQVSVRQVDLSVELQILSFYLNRM